VRKALANPHYNFWLMPAEPHKSQLHEIIRSFAREFGAPDFDPHVTLYHGPSTLEEAYTLVQTLAGDFAPLELKVQGLKQSEPYAKTLFIQFENSAAARQIAAAVAGEVADPAPYNFDPHLSLLYHHLDAKQREELCRRSLLSMDKIRFDGLCAVEFEPPWSDTSAREYEIIVEYGLREGFRRRREDMR
jgi:2'-5' RNA ligase